MTLESLKSLNAKQRETLEAAGWTIEDLATAEMGQLTKVKGIGKATAEKIVLEAQVLLNSRGLEDAERLAKERYYQKAPPAKVLEDWGKEGLSVQDVALATAPALARIKDIAQDVAQRLISAAQEELNKRKLQETRTITAAGPTRAANPAFPVEWLSGAVEPPPMSIRVRGNFERARKEYKKAND